MNPKEIRTLINYWKKTAEHDYETMLGLFQIKRYSDSLFFGHIVLEKILKAHVVKNTKKEAPYIHDLVRLASIAELELKEDDLLYLNHVNDFNIRARYPEYKFQFYKTCTKEFADKHLKQIIAIYKNLCQKIK